MTTTIALPATSPLVYELGLLPALFTAPDNIRVALEAIMTSAPLPIPESSASVTVAVREAYKGWQIEVDGVVVRGLAARTASAKVADEAVLAACVAIAAKTSRHVVEGVVLAKNGVAVTLVGDDIEAAKVVGLHLHSRGWTGVTFGRYFVADGNLEVTAIPVHTTLSSSSIDQLSARFRAAIESSLWYDSGVDLTFYTVNPFISGRSAPSANLTHAILVDGETEDVPAISVERERDRVPGLGGHQHFHALHVASLTLANAVETCDVVENWILSTASRSH